MLTPDTGCYYITDGSGTYTAFGNVVVSSDEHVLILTHDGTNWQVTTLPWYKYTYLHSKLELIPDDASPSNQLATENFANNAKAFKGWFNDSASLTAAYPTPIVGDYAYVHDADPATTTSIYKCATAGTWADSGFDVDTSNINTFQTSQQLNQVSIVNDLTTGGANNVLSAEQGKKLNQDINGIAQNFGVGYYIAATSGVETSNSNFETSTFIPITLEVGDVLEVNVGDTSGDKRYIEFFQYNTKTTQNPNNNISLKYYSVNASPRTITISSSDTFINDTNYFRICWNKTKRADVYVKLNNVTIYQPNEGSSGIVEDIAEINTEIGEKSQTSQLASTDVWGAIGELEEEISNPSIGLTVTPVQIQGIAIGSSHAIVENENSALLYYYAEAGTHIVASTPNGSSSRWRYGFSTVAPANGVSVTDDGVKDSPTVGYRFIDTTVVSSCYVIVSGSRTYINDCQFQVVDDLQDTINDINEDTSKAVITSNESVAKRLVACRFANSSNTSKCLNLLHFSDIHGGTDNLSRIVSFKNRWASYIDDAICTGDIVNANYSDTYIFDNTIIDGAENILPCIGNHDTLDGATATLANWYAKAGTQDAYNRYMANITTLGGILPAGAGENNYYPCYYYKDYSTSGVRLVVLDIMNWGKDVLNETTNLQSAWLDDVLADAISEQLHVVIAEHFPFLGEDKYTYTKKANVLDSDFSLPNQIPSATSGSIYSQITPSLDVIQSKIEAFKTNGGVFVCWICGHTHYDVLEEVLNTTQRVICVGTANRSKDTKTIRNTTDESMDLFNICSIDTINRIVKVFRIGSHLTPALQKIDTMYFTY